MNSTTSSSSNGYDFISAIKQPVVYTYSVTISLIVIINVLNACVLCRRTLLVSPCTYYFLGSIPPVLLNVIVAPLNGILQNAYGFYISGTQVTCKLVQYVVFGSSLLYGMMLVCASIDRFCSSSSSDRLRRLCQVRIAQRVIIIVWILVLLYMSPFLIIYYYDYNSSVSNKCVPYSTTPATVYLISRVILYYFMIPIILSIFGALTIKNIQSLARRVAPVQLANFNRRTEGQLARMLIIQVAVYLLFFTPAGIIYIIVTFQPSMNTPYYNAIRTVTVVWQQGGYFIAFFLYVLTGKVYRRELKKMFKCNQIPDQI